MPAVGDSCGTAGVIHDATVTFSTDRRSRFSRVGFRGANRNARRHHNYVGQLRHPYPRVAESWSLRVSDQCGCVPLVVSGGPTGVFDAGMLE
jgi:hypothetical protein